MHPDIPLLCKDKRGNEEIVEKMSKEVMLSLRGRVRRKEDDFSFVFIFNHSTLFLMGNIFNFPLVKFIYSCEVNLSQKVHETFSIHFHSCPVGERCERTWVGIWNSAKIIPS